MRRRWIDAACLLAVTAAVILAAGLPEPPREPPRVKRQEAVLFADPVVRSQLEDLLGGPVEMGTLPRLAAVRTLALECGSYDGRAIQTLADLPKYLPDLEVLALDFYGLPMTAEMWEDIDCLPLKRLGVSACGGFEHMRLPEGLERLALDGDNKLQFEAWDREAHTLPEGLLLTRPETPLRGTPIQYYRYTDEAGAAELVLTDAWERTEYGREYESRLLLSCREGDAWSPVGEYPLFRDTSAHDGLRFADVDFDGRMDILVLQGHFGNQYMARWTALLQREDGFEESPSFSEIPNPAVDPERRCVYGQWRNWAASHSWGVYEYRDGAFELVRCLTEEPVEESYTGEAPNGTVEVWQYFDSAATEVWRTDEHTKEETWDRFFDASSPDWGIGSDRWRTLANGGLMADFSVYDTDTMRSITQ